MSPAGQRLQLKGSRVGVVRGLLESALQGWLGRGSLGAGYQVGVDWAFWEAVCGVFQERAVITGIYFPPCVTF